MTIFLWIGVAWLLASTIMVVGFWLGTKVGFEEGRRHGRRFDDLMAEVRLNERRPEILARLAESDA